MDAVLTLGGHPLGLLDAFDTKLAQAAALPGQLRIHGDEPLFGGAEEDGRLGPPAVGIAVRQGLFMQKAPFPPKTLHDQWVAVEDVPPFQLWILHRRKELAIGPHQLEQTEVMGQVEVVHAVIGSRMHQARARIRCDVVRQQHGTFAIDPGVPCHEGLEFLASANLDRVQLHTELRREIIPQRNGHDVMEATGPYHGVFEIRVHGHGQVAGQGPWGGGPDGQEEGNGQVQAPGLGLRHGEGHGDGGAGPVSVFDLGLGQGRAGAIAPVDHLQFAGDAAALEKLRQVAHGLRFIQGIHGHIGSFPCTQHAQALEGGPLDIDPLLGIGAAFLQEIGTTHLAALGAEILFDGVLDGQAVAVPARHVG